MFSTIHKADSAAAEGMQAGKRRAHDYSKLQQVAWGSCQFLTTEPIFAVEVIILQTLQVGLTPIAAYSHSYLLLRFSWALQAQPDPLSHSNYVSC